MSVCGGKSGGLLLGSGGVGENAHDVAFLHDQQLLAVDLDLGARPLAKQHAVADLKIDRDQLAALVAAAGASGDDFALGGLFLGRVGNDDAACGLLFGVDPLDHDAIVKWTEFHAILLGCREFFLGLAGATSECYLLSFIPVTPGRKSFGPTMFDLEEGHLRRSLAGELPPAV